MLTQLVLVVGRILWVALWPVSRGRMLLVAVMLKGRTLLTVTASVHGARLLPALLGQGIIALRADGLIACEGRGARA